MKQLKVIANEYNNENGLMQVNYNEQILVRPGSKLALDKFTMDVTNAGTTSNIILPVQNISVNCDQPTQSPRIVTIPGATYATVSNILDAWNEAANSILETSITFPDQDVPDNGLYFGSNWITLAIRNNLFLLLLFVHFEANQESKTHSANFTTQTICYYL